MEDVKWFILTMQTERCGWGLVADEDIKAGSFLIEYVGEGEKMPFCVVISYMCTYLVI